jgi:hypothetical protein
MFPGLCLGGGAGTMEPPKVSDKREETQRPSIARPGGEMDMRPWPAPASPDPFGSGAVTGSVRAHWPTQPVTTRPTGARLRNPDRCKLS